MLKKNFEIKKYLHLNDNYKIDKNNKTFKLRPYLDTLNANFLKFGIFYAHLSIDEMMIRYYRMHSAKMFMKDKLIKFGYKLWCFCAANGYLYNFLPYLGINNKASNESLELRVICHSSE